MTVPMGEDYITAIVLLQNNPRSPLSVGQPLRRIGQLPFRSFRVAGRRVQGFVAEDLGKPDQIPDCSPRIDGPSCAEADGGAASRRSRPNTCRIRPGCHDPSAGLVHQRRPCWIDRGPGFQIACNARRAGSGSGTDRCLFPLPSRKTTEPLRSPSIRSCSSRATRSRPGSRCIRIMRRWHRPERPAAIRFPAAAAELGLAPGPWGQVAASAVP